MTKKLVEIGEVYTAKISGKLVPVRIDRNRGEMLGFSSNRPVRHKGWDATNMTTGQKIHIRTAVTLRGHVENFVGR